MIKNRKIAFGLFVVLVLGFWTLFDYLFSRFMTRSPYDFSALSDLAIPLLIAAISGYLLFLRKSGE